MSEFEFGQQVSWDDFLWDVVDPALYTLEPRDPAKYVYLWDGGSKYCWAPIDEVGAY